MAISRETARKLAGAGSKFGVTVLGGTLKKEGERYTINKVDVSALLEALVSQNVLLLIDDVEEETEEETKVCMTCGNEYIEDECPRCANVRSRLRGEEQ